MKTLKYFFILVALFTCGSTFAQEAPKHEFRLSYSDALPLRVANILGVGISDALTGTKRSNINSPGMFSAGYRYHINKIRLGADLAFFPMDSKIKLAGEKDFSVKDNSNSFLLLPTGELQYFKSGIIELYGSASAGAIYTTHKYIGLTENGKTFAKKNQSDNFTKFAYQVNPIALRIGNDQIGGFIEAGLGYKGFLNMGVNFRF